MKEKMFSEITLREYAAIQFIQAFIGNIEQYESLETDKYLVQAGFEVADEFLKQSEFLRKSEEEAERENNVLQSQIGV